MLGNASSTCGLERDLVRRASSAFLFWCVPLCAFALGFHEPPALKTILWTTSAGFMGVMCLRNAFRCGRAPQPNLACLLSTIASCRQTSQTGPDGDDAKTSDCAQQRSKTRSKLCLNPRQLLTAPFRKTSGMFAAPLCRALSLSS